MNDDDGAVDLLIGVAVARRVQQFTGVKNEALELAVALATKQVLDIVSNSEGNPLEALDSWMECEEIMATESA